MITIEEKLKRTQQELEELKEEYQEFAYVVSHDFNAPFRQIEGLTQLVVQRHSEAFDEKTAKHFHLIAKGTKKCQALLGALLKFSRVNTRTEPFEPVNCDTIMADVQKKLVATIEESSANITYQELPTIHADRHQICQLFYQLLKNSLTYKKPEIPPQISISVKPVDTDWQFCVEDNGIGIPEKLIGRVFTVLRRAVGEDEYPGEGAGLAISKKIVQRHGGKIWIDSVENKGTKIYFNLPKIAAE